MKLLAIDTSTDRIVLGLFKDGEKISFIGQDGSKKHNSVLLTYVDALLKENGLTCHDIDVYGVVVGPGSFTGIRIGVATVNAIAFACKKKIVAITSLEQLDDGEEKTVLLDCKHGNYYAATFGKETHYFETNLTGLTGNGKIEYLTQSDPIRILDKCIEKSLKKDYTTQAKPFYMKKSSAER